MSTDGLRIGVSGLAASQRALETAAHNLANVNTEGYSRQRVETRSAAERVDHRGILGPGTTGQGVVITGVSRAQDELLATNIREQSASLGSWSARADFTGRAEQIFGPLEGGTGTALSGFWNAWDDLSADPRNSTGRQAVIEAGRTLAATISDAATRLEGLRRDVGFDVQVTIDRVNAVASHVAQLNQLIAVARSSGDSPMDLLDQRNVALRELSELTGASAIEEAGGNMRVTIGGMPLVDGPRATPVTVTPVPLQPVWPGGKPLAASGRLGSLVEIATTGIDGLVAKVDELALGLRDLVNTTHRAGYGRDGVDGRDFFAGVDARSFGLDPGLSVDTVAASAAGHENDGNHAVTMSGLRDVATSSGSTVNDLFNSLQGMLGAASADATNQRRMAEAIVSELDFRMADVAGVSTDEEMADLLKYQRAYEASARVITIMDQMMDRLINGTGATR